MESKASRLVLSTLLISFMCTITLACSGQKIANGSLELIPTSSVEAYLFYVEDVILPDAIYEDEPAYFDLRVSADSNPSALQGLSHERWGEVSPNFRLYGDPQELWMLDACVLAEVEPQAEESDLLPVSLPGMPVGEWVCIVRCAANRALGGRRIQYRLTPSSGPHVPPEDLQEIRFTVNVIPRPDE